MTAESEQTEDKWKLVQAATMFVCEQNSQRAAASECTGANLSQIYKNKKLKKLSVKLLRQKQNQKKQKRNKIRRVIYMILSYVYY